MTFGVGLCCQHKRLEGVVGVFSRWVQVHVCEFCGKRMGSVGGMGRHEADCTLNPGRVCEWGGLGVHSVPGGLAGWVVAEAPLDEEKVGVLREKASGCPFCMLSAVRQSGLRLAELYVDGWAWDYYSEIGARSGKEAKVRKRLASVL